MSDARARCRACGGAVAPDDAFCGTCGHRVAGDAEAPLGRGAAEPVGRERRRSGSLFVVGTALVAAGVVALVVTRDRGGGDERPAGAVPAATTTKVPPAARETPPVPPTPPTTAEVPPAARETPPVPPSPPTTAEVPPAARETPPVPPSPPTTAEVPPAARETPPVPPSPPTTAEVPPAARETPPAPPSPPTTAEVPPAARETPPAPPTPPTTAEVPSAARETPPVPPSPPTTAEVPPAARETPPAPPSPTGPPPLARWTLAPDAPRWDVEVASVDASRGGARLKPLPRGAVVEPRTVLAVTYARSGSMPRVFVATVRGPTNGGGQDLDVRSDTAATLRAGDPLTLLAVSGIEPAHAELVGAGCQALGYAPHVRGFDIVLGDDEDGRRVRFRWTSGESKR